MMFHPTSRDLIGPDEVAARRNEIIAVATHALALASIPISILGFGVFRVGLVWSDHWSRRRWLHMPLLARPPCAPRSSAG